MRVIDLDALSWKTPLDFYDALLAKLGVPDWHGRNINALSDTMIWTDELAAVKPPYIVKISCLEHVPANVKNEVVLARDWLAESRAEYRERNGRDVEVSVEIT